MAKIGRVISTISKILLFPIVAVYGFITASRNYLYDKKILKSIRFDFPVIGVGNLSAGGTGKTPHIEYLIFHLQYLYRVATLSRGYGRKSYGFLMADNFSTSTQIGDEPRQFKKKFPETIVTVGEDRVLALPKILHERPDTDVILLDDAFQHRSIRAGLSVLLTEYGNRFTHDSLIPLGWLREAKSNYHRADIIIVTKCPPAISLEERQRITAEINPHRYQKVYFSAIQYGPLYSFYNPQLRAELTKDVDVLLVCGIARYEQLKSYLETKGRKVYIRDYKDHHNFDRYDLDAIRETFNNLGDVKKIIVTTEKDAARLEEFTSWFSENKIEIFVQPIQVKFIDDDGDKFNSDVLSYIEHVRPRVTE
ncbi:MAG TPA: tetraacyldisaccharide 4'-kinase [Chitinophagales bacterium]|nr:tetraacyldisaccharide 4'-kinase [Chitinophagales bacterium]